MPTETQANDHLTIALNPGHTSDVMNVVGDKYFTPLKEGASTTERNLDLNKVWDARDKLVLGIALKNLAEEILNKIATAKTGVELILKYSDKMDADTMQKKADAVQAILDGLVRERGNVDDAFFSTRQIYNNLANVDTEITAALLTFKNDTGVKDLDLPPGPLEPSPDTDQYIDRYAEWKLRNGYRTLASVLATMDMSRATLVAELGQIKKKIAAKRALQS